ncbi:hypothetical protein [Devosia sp. A449]
MTPAQAIAALDGQIADHGQAIAFRRGAIEQNAAGFVRGYDPEQLVGMITQRDRKVIVSPSSLGSYEIKENDDFAITAGAKLGKVISAEPIHIGATLVRWNLLVTLA